MRRPRSIGPVIGLRGVEFRWFGADTEGHLAHFVSGGAGPVPIPAWDSREEQRELLAYLEARPETTRARKRWAAGWRPPDEELAMARRGLFAYDYWLAMSAWDQEYKQMVYPETPLTLEELPRGLRAAAEAVVFGSLRFARRKSINPLDYFACVS